MSISGQSPPLTGRGSRIALSAVFALLATLAAGLIYAATPWGLGLTPDSISYFEAARLFSQPSGVWSLPSQWPPMFSATLAAGVALLGNLVAAGRCLQALFAAANLLLSARLLRACGISPLQTGLLLLMLILQPGFLHPHLMLWSEPEFLALAMLDLLLLERAIGQPGQMRWLLPLAVACAAAILVRYAGLFLLAVNAIGLLVIARDGWNLRSRLRAVVVVSIVSMVPFAAWIMFNRFRGAAAVNREFAWHPLGAEHWQQLQLSISTWFHLPQWFTAPALIMLALATVALLWRSRRNGDAGVPMRMLVALYLLGYALFVLVSISFVDQYTPLDERILFPALPAALAVFASSAAGLSNRWLGRFMMLPLFVALLANVGAGVRELQVSRYEGIGLADRSIQTMPVLVWLRQVRASATVVTNGPELFRLYLGREATMLPAKYVSSSGKVIPDYQAQLRDSLQKSGVVVYFYPLGWRAYLPTPDELDRMPGLKLVYSDKDALVWVRSEP